MFQRKNILRNSDFTMSHMIGYVSNIIFNMNIHVLMRGFRNYVHNEHARYRMTYTQRFIIAKFLHGVCFPTMFKMAINSA